MRSVKSVRLIAAIILMTFLLIPGAWAASVDQIKLDKNHSTYVHLWGLQRVAIGNPEIADVTVVGDSDILVVAKAQGSTTLQVWFNSGSRKTYEVIVTERDDAVAGEIAELIDMPNIIVRKVGDRILLEGSVGNQSDSERAEKIARLYASEVENMLELEDPQQVRIEAKIVEISVDKSSKLGVQYFNASDVDSDTGIVTPGTSGAFNLGQTWQRYNPHNYAGINATLNALINSGDARLLSQPNIVTMSGSQADILIGGQIPVPVSNDDGNTTVEWHDYGIKLEIEPRVGIDEQITSKISAEVSTIDTSSATAVTTSDGYVIPALRTRKANTEITLLSGTTMAIGGLISSEEGKVVSKIPLLGNLPIIGNFFKHTSKTKERREIVILITPIFVGSDYQPQMSADLKEYIEKRQAEEELLANPKPDVPEGKADVSKAKKSAKAADKPKVRPSKIGAGVSGSGQ